MNAAHALISTDVIHDAITGKGAVHAKAKFAQPHYTFIASKTAP